MNESARSLSKVVPAAHREWGKFAGRGGLRHALAEAFGDADRWWETTQLPLFDPAFRTGPPLPAVVDPGALYECLHPDRRMNGVYYTPDRVVDWVVANVGVAGPVLDPACGAGAFLRGVLRRCAGHERDATLGQLHGRDSDPLAVMLTQALLVRDAGGRRRHAEVLLQNIQVADSLRADWPAAQTVLTNPPFLTRLRELTAIDADLARSLRERLGPAAGPYTDVSALFLLRARQHAPRVGIVLPASVCATRDAAGIRLLVGPPRAAWSVPDKTFTAVGVAMVAACWTYREATVSLTRWVGMPPRLLDDVDAPTGSWGQLLATDDEPPSLLLPESPRLGDVALVEADFRDEYYHLSGKVHEYASGRDIQVFTSGLIGLGRSEWGEHPTRIHRAPWKRPAVNRRSLHPRQASRVGDLVLVATQTPVIEACCAAAGVAVGLTPVISIQARNPDGPWPAAAILAAVLSPVATAWAVPLARGAALTLDTIKLSAAQLRMLPLPPPLDDDTLQLAKSLGSPSSATQHREKLIALAGRTTLAYGADPTLVGWWARRARIAE